MSHWGLKKKGIEPLYPDEWNTVLDALDQLFTSSEGSVKREDLLSLPSDIIPDADAQRNLGSQDKAWLSVNAHSGNFIDSLTVQGKPVLKDGDPITVSDLGDDAVSKITQAVSDGTSYIAQLLTDLFREYATYGAISANDNTNGFSVTLAKGGRPYVNVYYRLGGAGIIYVRVSVDGSNWRTLDVLSLASAGEGVKVYAGVSYPFVQVATDATGVDAEFEVVASR